MRTIPDAAPSMAVSMLMPDGAIRIPILRLNRERAERETYAATRRFLENHLIKSRRPDEGITDDHWETADNYSPDSNGIDHLALDVRQPSWRR